MTTQNRMHNTLLNLAVSGAAVLLSSAVGHAATETDTQSRALADIRVFADSYCKTVPIDGHQETIEAEGKGKAALNDVLRKLVDLGFEGAVTYKSEIYNNVLRSDLASVLRTASNCRIEVLKLFESKFIRPLPQAPDTEDALWQSAIDVGRKSGYQRYLDSYPSGRYAAIATFRVAHIDEEGFELDETGKRICHEWAEGGTNWMVLRQSCKQFGGQFVQLR